MSDEKHGSIVDLTRRLGQMASAKYPNQEKTLFIRVMVGFMILAIVLMTFSIPVLILSFAYWLVKGNKNGKKMEPCILC